jgi:Ig-like domain CHU_C associated/Lysyl oxidase
MRNFVLLIISCLFVRASIAQCSVSNPAACGCPTAGSTNCLLLPDILAGKRTLNSTRGWSEYAQSGSGSNNGLLRIDVSTPNVGWGPLDVIATNDFVCGTDTFRNYTPAPNWLCPDGTFPKRLIKQKLYTKNGATFTFTERPAGWMTYHPTHGHIHVDNWGEYTLRIANASIADTAQWPTVSTGMKQSFCLIDLSTCTGTVGDCVDANGNVLMNTDFQNYGLGNGGGCGNYNQGISVGKVDIYSRGLDESFVKVPYEACNGDYYVVVKIDPLNNFQEMNENNNWLAAKVNLTRQHSTTNPTPYAYIFSDKGKVLCTGETMRLEASGASNYVWSTGANTQSINVSQAGDYWVRATTPCGVATSDTFKVAVIGNANVNVTTKEDTVCVGDYANLSASGTPYWYDAPTGGNLLYVGNNFTTGTLNANKTFYVAATPTNIIESGSFGPATINFNGNAGSINTTTTPYLIFNAFVPFKLKKVTVNVTTAGARTIQLRDLYGRKIIEKTVNLVAGTQDVLLDFFVPSGINHQLGMSTTGTSSLYVNSTTAANIGYPFTMKSIANIVGSSLGDQSYPFFYNWQIETTPTTCSQVRKAVTAYVVAKPSISFNGLANSYLHNAPGAALSIAPAGGTLNGDGIVNQTFYPKLAGVGAHAISYTYKIGSCIAAQTKIVGVNMNDSLLNDGFSIELFNTITNRPTLSLVANVSSPVEVRVVNAAGQTMKTATYYANVGSNFYKLSMADLPKAVYILQVYFQANDKQKTVRFIN